MEYEEYRREFKKLNHELFSLIDEMCEHKSIDFFEVMKIMGGQTNYNNVKNIYDECFFGGWEYQKLSCRTYNYRAKLLQYFKNNIDKHEEWIYKLKFYFL